MIAPEVVDRIRQMLDQGSLSQRGIARRLGVSRGTVNAIALGRRPDYEDVRRRREADEVPAPSGPPRRCPGCGALVLMPCVACRVRAIQNRRSKLAKRANKTLLPTAEGLQKTLGIAAPARGNGSAKLVPPT
jgi:hypothetical protein